MVIYEVRSTSIRNTQNVNLRYGHYHHCRNSDKQRRNIESPFLEIYLYNPPEAWACLEHQRQELAFRKRLHDDQD